MVVAVQSHCLVWALLGGFAVLLSLKIYKEFSVHSVLLLLLNLTMLPGVRGKRERQFLQGALSEQ